jgi:hypothetical protein
MSASTAKWDDLSIDSDLTASQLNNIATQLDSIASALVALTQIDATEMRQTAQKLQLESILVDWLNGWASRQTNPTDRIDVEQMRALVSISSHLAREYQDLVRRNLIYWAQTIEHHQLPLQSPSLADYISNFITIYQNRTGNPLNLSFEALTESALTLLLELLFYSSPNGPQRLWDALLQRSQNRVIRST